METARFGSLSRFTPVMRSVLPAAVMPLAVALTVLVPVVGVSRHWSSPARSVGTSVQPPSTSPAPDLSIPTQVEMRHVDFYVDPEVVLHIRRLRGTMTSKAGGPVLFDDKRSFVIHIATAEVGLSGKDLSALMNKYVFAYRGAPLKHLKVRTSGAEIVQSGVLHKGVDIPFEIHAQLDVTPQGMIRLHPTRTRILGVNGDALMRALGLSLEKLIDLSGSHGASVHGNDIVLDPERILPPPAIDGRVTSVRVEGDEVVQVFGGPAMPSRNPPDAAAPNYMYYTGGTLRFGRMLMLDAEMQIVDLDPSDPFRFDLDRYNAQLIAGYSRTLPDLGLEVYMRDIDKVKPGDTIATHDVKRTRMKSGTSPAAPARD